MGKKLSITGIISGFLAGLLGIGGGTILVPSFIHFFNFEQKKAQGTALFVMVFTSFFGFLTYAHFSPADLYNQAWPLVFGSAVGAVLGSLLSGRLNPGVLRKLFAGYLFFIGIKMLIA